MTHGYTRDWIDEKTPVAVQSGPERHPQVMQELDLNYKLTAELEAAVRELEGRLNTVLQPAFPATPRENEKNNRVPLAETLHSQGQIIQNVTEAISSIMKRLEV